MNILEKILAAKSKEVTERKANTSLGALEAEADFSRQTVSLAAALSREGSSGIIAEIKRKSPSKGMLHPDADAHRIAAAYAAAGAAGISVLTDFEFFGGSSDDLRAARSAQPGPLLRKDFIIDEYQIVEARSLGADVILLIAAALDAAAVHKLASVAHAFELEVLLEVHSEEELQRALCDEVDLVGVNNRDLKTFAIDVDLSRRLKDAIPDRFIAVAESGLQHPETVKELRALGYRGFLMGEIFMKEASPGQACANFIRELQ